jgi:hypothetical protein
VVLQKVVDRRSVCEEILSILRDAEQRATALRDEALAARWSEVRRSFERYAKAEG